MSSRIKPIAISWVAVFNLGALVLFTSAKSAWGENQALAAFGAMEFKEEPPAPDFTLPSLDGNQIQLSQYRGKVVLLNFFAIWCVPCQREFPLIEKLYKKYQDKGFVVLAVSLDRDTPEAVKAFVEELHLTFPVVLDPERHLMKMYRVMGLPTTYLISRQGKLLGLIVGERDWGSEKAYQLVNSLLGKIPEDEKSQEIRNK